MRVCFNKHFPEHCFLLVIFKLFNAKLLTWCAINIVECFHASTCFTSFITSANFGPALFNNLYPYLSFFINKFSSFISGKTKLFYSLFVSIKWKPFINNDFQSLSINIKLNSITTSFVVFVGQEIISYSCTQLQVRLLFLIFGESSKSS